MNILKKYYKACEEIAQEIVKRYGDPIYSFWVGDEIGGVFCLSDYYLSINEMVELIALDVTDEEFFEWYYWRLDLWEQEKEVPLNLKNKIREMRSK